MRSDSNILGKRFGSLTAIEFIGRQGIHYKWRTICDCGNTREALATNLKTGKTQRCEACRLKRIGASKRTHGHSAERGVLPYRRSSKEYATWCKIKRRCLNPNSEDYYLYGGRGITIAEVWRNDFAAFFYHVGRCPSINHSIDRKDNDKGYEPGNVRWATSVEQSNNKRNTRFLIISGERIPLAEAARALGVNPTTLRQRAEKRDWHLNGLQALGFGA